MTTHITPEMRAARPVAQAALEGRASAYGPVDAIVTALDSAGLLQSPERAAELARLRAERATLNEVLAGGDEERALLRARLDELARYETLRPQTCPAGQHRSWFVDAPRPLPCPWCEIAQAQAGRGEVYRAYRDGVLLGTYATMTGAEGACERALRADYPTADSEWIARPDADGLLDLITHHYGHTSATGLYVLLEEVLGEDEGTAAVTA